MIPLRAAAAAGMFAVLSNGAMAGDSSGGFSLGVQNVAGQAEGTAIASDGDGPAFGATTSSTTYVSTPVQTAPDWSAEAYSAQAASATGAGAVAITDGAVSVGVTTVFKTGSGQPGLASASSAASLAYEGTFGSYTSEVFASAIIQETAYGYVISAAAGDTTSATAAQAGVTTSSDSVSTVFVKGNNVLVESRGEALTQISGNGGTYLVANAVAIAVARATQYGLTSTSNATANESIAPANANSQSPATNIKGNRAASVPYGQPGSGLIVPSPGDYYANAGAGFALSPTLFTGFGLGWQGAYASGSGYDAPLATALLSWAYNDRVQLYSSLQYQGYTLDSRYLAYGDARVVTGIRIDPDHQDFLDSQSLDRLEAQLAAARRPTGTELTVSGGYSWFGLPDMKMATVVGGPYFDQALEQEKNSDGNLNGWRTDARLANFAAEALPDGILASFGVSGFFSNYQGVSRSRCMYGETTDCAIVNILDTDPNNENNTGPFGNLNVKVSRNVDYYGAAIDAHLGYWAPDGLKDGPAAEVLSPLKVGLALRDLSEAADLTSTDPLVSVPVRYKENLDTFYYGGFLGIEQKAVFGDGWIAAVDGTGGPYGAATQYRGRYNGYAVSYSSGYVQDSGSLDLSLDKAAFIGTLRLDLKRELGWGTIGVFGLGEYFSYVPRMLYNNNDQAGGPPWGIIGTQVGTHIGSSDAFNFTAGLSVFVPVN
jgi:hypothetical protein